MGTAAGGSYGCVGDEAVCEQQAQPWLPHGLSTLSAAPSYTVQGVSLCNHSAQQVAHTGELPWSPHLYGDSVH